MLLCFVLINSVYFIKCTPLYIDTINVGTSVGTFRGEVYMKEERELYIFKGIRYGTAPSGKNRFRKSQPFNQPANTVIEANEYGNTCPQLSELPDQFHARDEDCLFLNIWAPKSNKSLPVMFWIYGGAFQLGTASTEVLTPWPLAIDGEVVVVTFNYRVGVLGFLYDGTEEAPGNMGIYDQLLALQWVRKHIKNFGGNPKRITVFGESAGAISIGALILSPLAKGLFQRAIMQSGAPNVDFITRSSEYSWNKTQTIAKNFDCWYPKNRAMLIACLRSKTTDELNNATTFLGDTFLTYGTEMLPLRPFDALKRGKFNTDVDLLFGVVEDEGSLFVAYLLGYMNSTFDFAPGSSTLMTKSKAENYIHLLMNKMDMFKKDDIARIQSYYLEKVFKRYLEKYEESDAYRKAIASSFGDLLFVAPTIIFGGHFGRWAKTHNCYSYRLTYLMNVFQSMLACSGWMGVCHGGDIPAVFGFPRSSWLPLISHYFFYSEDDQKLSADMIRTWTEFARTGKISKFDGMKWQQATATKSCSVQ